jgi:hypothetical protein
MKRTRSASTLPMVFSALAFPALAVCVLRADGAEPKCKPIHADLVEHRSTTGCRPGHAACFLGEVDGNHGLRGTTYFRADSSAPGPSTSPGFIIYSGPFEYTTANGTLTLRETGVSNQTQGLPESGAVTAFQLVVGGTGEWSGATGHLFVSGFNANRQVVTTTITGQLCLP